MDRGAAEEVPVYENNQNTDGRNGQTDQVSPRRAVKSLQSASEQSGVAATELYNFDADSAAFSSVSEAAANQALPQVLKCSVEISGHGYHKGCGYETLTIAAPVALNGKRGNMAVVVMRTKGNRYKVHRSLPPEGTAFALPEMTNAELTTAGAFTNGSQSLGGSAPAISSASTASVAESESSVKQKYSLDDDTRELNAGYRRAVEKDAAELGGEVFTAYESAGDAVDISIAKPEDRFKNRCGKSKPVNAKHLNSEASRYSHDWLDNDSKNNKRRKILYDISPIKKVGQSVKSDTSLLSTGQPVKSGTSTVCASIAESAPSVKQKDSFGGEKHRSANNEGSARL